MPDLTAYATAGQLTEQGQPDLVAYASGGVFTGVIIVTLLPGRQLYAEHRQRFMLPDDRNFDLAEFRVFMLFAEARELELCASERNLTMTADERETELIADEEITW